MEKELGEIDSVFSYHRRGHHLTPPPNKRRLLGVWPVGRFASRALELARLEVLGPRQWLIISVWDALPSEILDEHVDQVAASTYNASVQPHSSSNLALSMACCLVANFAKSKMFSCYEFDCGASTTPSLHRFPAADPDGEQRSNPSTTSEALASSRPVSATMLGLQAVRDPGWISLPRLLSCADASFADSRLVGV